MRTLFIAGLGLALAACTEESVEPADTLYFNGTIITMEEEQRTVEALAVKDGRIQALGDLEAVTVYEGPDTRRHNLDGQTLMPGFIDAHGHLVAMANFALFQNLASPPVGQITNIADLQTTLRSHDPDITGGWIFGMGYDDALLAEGRHPNRDDLDSVSTERPIVIMHVSLHLAALNSRALEIAGISADTPNPEGGVIQRQSGSSEPNGVLEERAMYMALSNLPRADLEQQMVMLGRAQDQYAENGITTAQDGFTQEADLALLQAAAAEDKLFLDVVAYPNAEGGDWVMADTARIGAYVNRLKIGGVKFVLDGSPQGKTAWLSHPYHIPPPGQEEGYAGYPTMPDDRVIELFKKYVDTELQILAHANGDAAAEQLLDAMDAAGPSAGARERRDVMIHAQTVRDDQMDRMAGFGMIPSFYAAHAHFWGDWHRDSVLGPERAARISPAATAAEKGLTYSFHMDSPVLPPDMLRLVWSGVNRVTRSGQVLGPDERVSTWDGLKAVTINAAYQYFEEDEKGSLAVGKQADFVILSADPLQVDPMEIADIQVLQTIQDDVTIYKRP